MSNSQIRVGNWDLKVEQFSHNHVRKVSQKVGTDSKPILLSQLAGQIPFHGEKAAQLMLSGTESLS